MLVGGAGFASDASRLCEPAKDFGCFTKSVGFLMFMVFAAPSILSVREFARLAG